LFRQAKPTTTIKSKLRSRKHVHLSDTAGIANTSISCTQTPFQIENLS
jgi:hypothetical protein